ncbi:cytochrome P450 [Aspergillus californicus]
MRFFSLSSPWAWVAAGILYLVGRAVYNIYLHPLAKFPGPKLRAATRLAWVWSLASGSNHVKVKSLHDRYGPVVRIAPDELSFISPSAWQDIYTKGPANKGLLRSEAISDAAGLKHIFATHNESHTRLRRKFMQSLSDNGLAKHEPLLQRYASIMMVNWFAFDVIGDLTLSDSFHQLDNSAPDPWITLLGTYIKGMLVSFCLNHYWPLNRVLPTVAPKTYKRLLEQFMGPVREKVHRRLMRPDAEKLDDILASCMPHANGGKNIIDDEYLNLLGNDDRVMRKLCTEVRSISASQDITLAAVARMPYLNAVITEGLRLCHPITWSISRLTPPAGSIVGDCFVPGDTHVNILHYAVYNSESHFENADQFVPERWLGENPPEEGNNAAFQPFSLGGHSCPGRYMARAEMGLLLARLLHDFDIVPLSRFRWQEQQSYLTWLKRPMMVSLKQVPVCEA